MKQTRKAIEANMRNKLAAQYKAKTERLEEEIERLRQRNKELSARAMKAEQEKMEMRDKLNQFKDWNRRLQEYMDMGEEDRKAYAEKIKQEAKLNSLISEHFAPYLGLFM